ncbi:hypothetical protein GCM10027034_22640 [Ramlibacter solisilvae]|uniref:DUF6622 family protein n=1 Tax=Ramlibacter tataouinensis TaxID=94132 RepID=UPI0009EE7DBF|nr:DUF6622 family protein [Ramlibacter tataouinensis]
MPLAPEIAIHLTAAIGALAIGPVALWARKGATQRPRLHRAFGYAWVTLMVITAVSALFIHVSGLPNIAGFSPIHLLVPATLLGLFASFRHLAQGNIAKHRQIMQRLYWGACVAAGAFTLLPNRTLGKFVWGLFPSIGTIGLVLSHTPGWVWGLLAALLVLGFSQARDRQAGLARILLLPIAMGGYAIFGMVSAFGATPAVAAAWLMSGTVVAFALLRTGPAAGVRYDAATRQFFLPGSWVPMALILAVFLTRYVVNASLALHPELKADADIAIATAALYGVFSGLFAGRAAQLARLALRPAAAPVPAFAA